MLSLFLYIFLSFSSINNRKNKHIFSCHHDKEIRSKLRNSPPHKLKRKDDTSTPDDLEQIQKRISEEIKNRKHIRVKMELFAIDHPQRDGLACNQIGETKDCSGAKGSKCTCQEINLLNEDRKNVIKQTMLNAQDYITRLVNVTRYPNDNKSLQEFEDSIKDSLDDSDIQWTAEMKDLQYENTDLFIFVLPRIYKTDSDTLASARAMKYIDFGEKDDRFHYLDNGRPKIGLININVAKLPSSPQNYDSGDRQFFVTCMHELMHVLAFSSGLFGKWINRTSGTKYITNLYNFEFTNNYDIAQRFISTPKLTEWVHERFQVVNPQLLRFGLELEDGGGTGTAGSHPNSRLYFTDIMQGKTYGPGYFSPIFFHSLYDSGWYEPNYAMEEELVYLNPKYVSEPISQYVLTEPPRDSFPKELFCYNNIQAYCYYDYSYKAVCDTKTYNEMSEMSDSTIKSHMQNPNFTTWYGGPNNRYSDEENLDYMPILFPSGDSNCRNENAPLENEDVGDRAKRMEETYSTSSVCLLTTIWKQSLTQFSLQKNAGCYKARCGEDNKLRITLPKTNEQVCYRENQRIYKKGSTKYALCPNVEAACANFPNKSTMVTAESVIPDRGPNNGQNYISILGFNLNAHPIKKITFGIIKDKTARVVTESEYEVIVSFEKSQFLDYSNEHILVRMPELDVGKKQIGVPIDLIFETETPIDVNFIEEVYTFLKRDYNNPDK